MIFIKRMASRLVGTVGSPSDGRRRDSRFGDRDRTAYPSSIRRWIAPHEEPRSTRDRGPIGMRSWRIQRQIGAPSSRNRPHSSSNFIRRSLIENRQHDRCTIMARSRRDRGPIVAILKRNRGSFKANPEATTPPRGITSTTPSNRSHDRTNCPRFWANFPFKKPCILPLFFNF